MENVATGLHNSRGMPACPDTWAKHATRKTKPVTIADRSMIPPGILSDDNRPRTARFTRRCHTSCKRSCTPPLPEALQSLVDDLCRAACALQLTLARIKTSYPF